MSELLPCPFCGSDNLKEYIWRDGDETVDYIQCSDCTACGPDHKGSHHWNTRLLRRAGNLSSDKSE